jgi:hypothetical protein
MSMKSLLRVVALVLIFSAAYGVQVEASRLVCYGTCTVECGSGETYSYPYTAAHRCCEKEVMCPGGTGTVTWFPEPSWECWNAWAFVCPYEP